MKTSIIFTNGDKEDHVCLDGDVEPVVDGAFVRFASENGEKFYVNHFRFIGAYIFEDEDNVVPFKPEVVAAN